MATSRLAVLAHAAKLTQYCGSRPAAALASSERYRPTSEAREAGGRTHLATDCKSICQEHGLHTCRWSHNPQVLYHAPGRDGSRLRKIRMRSVGYTEHASSTDSVNTPGIAIVLVTAPYHAEYIAYGLRRHALMSLLRLSLSVAWSPATPSKVLRTMATGGNSERNS